MKKIILTRGLFALVDDREFPALSKHKWYALKTGKNGRYYARRRVGRGFEYMHRRIMKAVFATEVNHKDGTTLDNRLSNMELLTKTENLRKRIYSKR